jgi:hypothetical protein
MFFPTGAEDAHYDADLMTAKFARDTAAHMREKCGTPYVRYDFFVALIENLKREILDGKHDDKLRAKPARAIYDLLRLDGKVRSLEKKSTL